MSASHDPRRIIVGGVVFLGLIVLLGFSHIRQYVGLVTGPETYTLEAVFNRIDGLLIDAPVRLGGIEVGKVSAERLDEYHRAVITLSITKDIRLPADTSAAIHTDGLFGEKYIVLEPGGDDIMLEEGEAITFTQDAVILSELLDLIISRGHSKPDKLLDK